MSRCADPPLRSRRRAPCLAVILAAAVGILGCSRETGRDGTAGRIGPTENPPGSGVRRPNIVLILADDVGREALGCYGGTIAETPHIDSLAESGLRFEHCYGTPKCHPSRAELMTGLYPFRMGFAKDAPRSQNLMPYRRLPQLLAEAGYDTGIVGKWHLGSQEAGPRFPGEFGFDEYDVWGRSPGGDRNPKYYGAVLRTPDGSMQLDPRSYTPEVLNAAACSFVRRERDRPFFLYYPTLLIHSPPHVPPGISVERSGDRGLVLRAMIGRLDEYVGRLLVAIRDSGEEEQTLIIFASDNGGAIQEIGGEKGLLTDGGTRLPCLIRWPGVVGPGGVSDGLIDFSDFLPTLCELASCDPASVGEGDGRSFAGLLRSGEPAPRAWVFSEWNGDYFVRDHRWKLYGDGRLIDMEGGSRETTSYLDGTDTPLSRAARAKLARVLFGLGLERGEASDAPGAGR